MKTVICLQNAGFANHPNFKIVVMGQKKNRKGRYIEHLGQWLPLRRTTRGRSILLNKPRIHYWLAMGAEPCPKVRKFLSYVHFTPQVLHPFGKDTWYQRNTVKTTRYFNTHESYRRLMKFYGYHYKKYRKGEEDSKLYKEFLLAQSRQPGMNSPTLPSNLQQLDYQLQEEAYSQKVEGIQQDDSLEHRSRQFYHIRYLLEQQTVDKVQDKGLLQRVHDKLNQLAQKGLMSEQQYQRQILQLGTTDEQQAQDRKDVYTLQQLKQNRLDTLLLERQQKIQGFHDMLQGMSKQEFGKFLVEKRGYTATQAQDATEFEFDMAKVSHQVPTKQDALEYGIYDSDEEVEAEQCHQLYTNHDKQDSMFMPRPTLIHQFPDIFNYNPKEYYDLDANSKGFQQSYEEQFNYDRAYDLGNIDEYKIQEKSKKIKVRTYKAGAGKPLKRKLWFSTVIGQTVQPGLDLSSYINSHTRLSPQQISHLHALI